MFEAHSQNFASAPRGFKLEIFRPAFGEDHRGTIGGAPLPRSNTSLGEARPLADVVGEGVQTCVPPTAAFDFAPSQHCRGFDSPVIVQQLLWIGNGGQNSILHNDQQDNLLVMLRGMVGL